MNLMLLNILYCLLLCSLCSYNVDNADGVEGECSRLKSRLYHEETASTCSGSDQSMSTLLSSQPTKLVKTTLQQSRGTGSDRRKHSVSSEHEKSVTRGHKSSKTNDASNARYFQCVIIMIMSTFV